MIAINDELKYILILVLSVLVGFPLRSLPSSLSKQIVTSLIGCTLVFGVCEWDGLHSFLAFAGNVLIIKLSRKHTSLLSFVWCFTYLLFFRCATFFGLPKPPPLANAIQLMLTLKLVSVAIEIHDFRTKKKDSASDKTSAKFQLELEFEPSVFDMFCYAYCYTGIFTGPFFKYRTYYDYLKMHRNEIRNIPVREEILSRVKQVTVFGVLYGVAAYFFSVGYVKSGKLYDDSFFYQVFYMVPIFFIGRMRFYSAWLTAECAFVSLGLGAYDSDLEPRPGHGPTIKSSAKQRPLLYSFKTIANIDPYGCDFSSTVRLGMRNWNMGVQWWLACYVHKRWPPALNQFRIGAVMAVSAYWHGIDPGFFGAFLTMPLVMMAEDLLSGVVKKRLPPSLHKSYDWLNWFAKMRAFEYMYMAFALLTWEATYTYWKATYFWLHIISVLLIVVCLLTKAVFPLKRKEQRLKDEAKKVQ